MQNDAKTPNKLLLHACCGPCSLEPVRIWRERGVEPVIYYANSNIAPACEYELRRNTIADWCAQEGIPFIEGPYRDGVVDPRRDGVVSEVFAEQNAPQAGTPPFGDGVVSEVVPSPSDGVISEVVPSPRDGVASEVEKQKRCRACYRMRFSESARYAAENGYDALGTTLSISPYQFTEIIGEELERAAEAVGIDCAFEDYTPYFPEATRRSREAGMYRQNYCGCLASREEAEAERTERRALRDAKKAARKAVNAAAQTAAQLKTSDFDYALCEELIAQEPHVPRDECRLLTLNRKTGQLDDKIFRDIIDMLEPGDLLVANETRVLPARLLGHKRATGGAAEVFLLRECAGPEPRTNKVAFWEALVRPGNRLKPGTEAIVDFTNESGDVVLSAQVIDWIGEGDGERKVRLFTELPSLDEALHAVGRTPLPPYIKDYAGDNELYQTVYSRRESSAAAPTAGLHFTPELIDACKAKGVHWATVELEVGLDTFRIVDEEKPADHAMHTEFYTVPEETAKTIEACKERGGQVIAVGTTSVRSLESAWHATHLAGKEEAAQLEAIARAAYEPFTLAPQQRAATSLFLLPGAQFHVVDALITNFHVPRSTLMMLVSAFASREQIMDAYAHAIDKRYRFLSFGDAMFIH